MFQSNNSGEIKYHSSYGKSFYLFKNFSAMFRVNLHPFSSNHKNINKNKKNNNKKINCVYYQIILYFVK